MIFEKNRNLVLFIFMLLLVPLVGQLKIHPFGGDFASFRVSFGSPIFLLFLLSIKNINLAIEGFCTGIMVVLFRALLDVWFYGIAPITAIWLHIPTFFYYLVYAACFLIPHFNKQLFWNKALQIAGWSIFAEIFASIAELATMSILFNNSIQFLSLVMILKLAAIAFLRCFFILSFFFLTQLYVADAHIRQENEEKQRLMLMIANLYKEVVQLDKSQKNAENITRECYKIYECLQNEENILERQELAPKILAIAEQLHEIKKDNQRIYAGLIALTNNHRVDDYLPAKELVGFIIDSHRKYAGYLGKNINFSMTVSGSLPDLHVYTLLSLLGNLVSNAVEAIQENGSIHLALIEDDQWLRICVNNTGSAISPRKLKLVFQPGYTTKFDAAGNASTGMGLPYVKHLAGTLGGTIEILSDGENKVDCTLMIPLSKLKG
jgi:two-component system sensor histidine kinase YcbA